MSDEQTSILLLASDWQTAHRPVPRWKFLDLTTEGNTIIRRYSVILDDSQSPRTSPAYLDDAALNRNVSTASNEQDFPPYTIWLNPIDVIT